MNMSYTASAVTCRNSVEVYWVYSYTYRSVQSSKATFHIRFTKTCTNRLISWRQILAAMKKEPLGKWYEMAEAVMPEMTTDMDTDAIFDYMKCVVLMGATEFEQFRIPVDGSYTNEYAGKQEVLGVDLDANIKAYNKFINEE